MTVSGREEEQMKNLGKKRVAFIGRAMLIVISCCVMFLLFWHLGAASVNATDEAYHGVNAYEMLKSGNWIVNTYRYETDYFNSKPPLNLWLIMLAYRLFGASSFSLRFPAATAGALIYFLLAAYLWKKRGIVTANLFGLAFLTNVLPFTFHMFRSGDMDSVYCLFFTIAILALFECQEHPNALLVYGAAVGLAFLTKGVHAGVILVIGVVCIPAIRRSLSLRRVLGTALIMALPICVWALPRYLYDGTAFFSHGVIGEMSDKIVVDHVGDITFPLREMLLQKNWQLLIVCLAAELVIAAAASRRGKRAGSGEGLKNQIRKLIRNYYILLATLVIPMILYMAVQTRLEWYYYPCYVFGNVATALLAEDVRHRLKRKWMRAAWLFSYAAACFVVFFHIVRIIYVSDISGDPLVILQDCIYSEKEDYGTAYCGKTAYIQNEYNSYREQDEWQCDAVFYAETIMDWKCRDGGVAGFLNDESTDPHVLILSESLWDQYSGELTGYVILQDNGYLILSSEKYASF